VNNQTYRGDWETDAITRALCAGFVYGSDPEFCKIEPWFPEDNNSSSPGVGVWQIVLIIFLCLVLVAVVLVFYRMWMKRELKDEMRRQVNSTVSQYFALSDTSTKSGVQLASRDSYN